MTCLCASSDGVFLFGGSFTGKLYILFYPLSCSYVWCISSGDLLNVIDAHYKAFLTAHL